MKRIALGVELWSPDVRPMLLAAARFAGEIGAGWMAISVSHPGHMPSKLLDGEKQRVQQNVELVASLGGKAFFCDGEDVAGTLLAAALVHGAEMLLLGKPHHGVMTRLFAPSVADTLIARPTPNLPLMFIGVDHALNWR